MSDHESQPATDDTEPTDPPQASSGTSQADADHSGGTASPDSEQIGGISDDQLPEDLQPTDDNPLAKPLDPDDEATKSRAELEMDAAQEEDEAIAGTDAGQATEEPDAGTEDTSTTSSESTSDD